MKNLLVFCPFPVKPAANECLASLSTKENLRKPEIFAISDLLKAGVGTIMRNFYSHFFPSKNKKIFTLSIEFKVLINV